MFPWRVNHHIWPQMLFLTDHNGIPLDIDYIGDMENMNNTLPYLFQTFTNVDEATVCTSLSISLCLSL